MKNKKPFSELTTEDKLKYWQLYFDKTHMEYDERFVANMCEISVDEYRQLKEVL